MDGLRPRKRLTFSGFSKAEVEKMEKLLKDSVRPMNKEFFQKIARRFNHSSGRAGKPVVKWTEVENWFQTRQNDFPSKVDSSSDASKGDKASDLSELEFEARSSKDGAWYDIDEFLSHRFLPSGEAEVHVRFVGFGAEEDEWVNVKNAVRERSVPLEHSECQNVQIGDMLCCFQERRDQAIFYDAHVVDIEKRTHDIRGCRCLFTIRYEHENTEEIVRLRRLCRRPTN